MTTPSGDPPPVPPSPRADAPTEGSIAPADFAQWYAEEFPRVSRALALAAGDPALGEEAAAEAFARALAQWRRVAAMQAPGAWVYTVGSC